jgi:hypothetical protein
MTAGRTTGDMQELKPAPAATSWNATAAARPE